MQNNTIDPKIKALVSAIGETETGRGGPEAYTKRGASGEYGRYQYRPDTWNMYAKEAGVNKPLEQASIEDQNKVTYHKIKQLKDRGFSPAQIASMWNAGEDDPDAYKGTFSNGKPSVGINEFGVRYDVPDYARKVSEAYQRHKGEIMLLSGQTQQPVPQGQPDVKKTPEQELMEISNRRLGQANTAIEKGLSGEYNPLSSALQVGGAAAGGALDLLGLGAKKIPVVGGIVQAGEDVLGKVATAAAETEIGKDVLQGVSDFTAKHPEAAANIGAAVDIASAIPIVKGLTLPFKAPGMVKNSLFKGAIEKEAVAELNQAASTRITGSNLLKDNAKRGINPTELLVKERLLPDVEADINGVNRYNTVRAEQQLSKQIDDLDDQLDVILREAGSKISGYVNTDDLRRLVIEEIEDQFKGSPEMDRAIRAATDDIDSILRGYGDQTLLTLEDLNQIKRNVRKSVNFKSNDLQKLEKNVNYHEGQVFMRIIEDVTDREFKKLGLDSELGSVKELNKQMAERLVAQELLRRHISGKRVTEMPKFGKLGMMGEAALISGLEAGGQAIGAPVVGSLVGKMTSNAARKPKKTALARLKSKEQKRGILQNKSLPTALTVQGMSRGYQEEQQARQ